MVTKSVFHPRPCDAHVAAFFSNVFIFSTPAFTGKAGVFDVSASLDAMQIN